MTRTRETVGTERVRRETAGTETAGSVNEVHLVGRVSGEPVTRELPSGDELVQFRLVVPRALRRDEDARRQVDTIEVACWSARTRRTASRLPDGQTVEVQGSLRRRFFGTAGGRASRYEVEAGTVRRVPAGGEA